MKGILLRVAADTTKDGGRWNGPVDVESGDFVYVPIPQARDRILPKYRPGPTYRDLLPVLHSFSGRHDTRIELPEHLADMGCHLDPNFDELTYGDQATGRGLQISRLKKGDFIAFFAGLKPVVRQKPPTVYALIGLMFVDQVVRVGDASPDELSRNIHGMRTARGTDHRADDDLVVFADRARSGRLRRCIQIGELRRAPGTTRAQYRVRRELLNQWGGRNGDKVGIDVRDGWIQRSVSPPSFLDPDSFLRWFDLEKPELVAANNPRTR